MNNPNTSRMSRVTVAADVASQYSRAIHGWAYVVLAFWSLMLFIFTVARLIYTLSPRSDRFLNNGMPFYGERYSDHSKTPQSDIEPRIDCNGISSLCHLWISLFWCNVRCQLFGLRMCKIDYELQDFRAQITTKSVVCFNKWIRSWCSYPHVVPMGRRSRLCHGTSNGA